MKILVSLSSFFVVLSSAHAVQLKKPLMENQVVTGSQSCDDLAMDLTRQDYLLNPKARSCNVSLTGVQIWNHPRPELIQVDAVEAGGAMAGCGPENLYTFEDVTNKSGHNAAGTCSLRLVSRVTH